MQEMFLTTFFFLILGFVGGIFQYKMPICTHPLTPQKSL